VGLFKSANELRLAAADPATLGRWPRCGISNAGRAERRIQPTVEGLRSAGHLPLITGVTFGKRFVYILKSDVSRSGTTLV
jgi:hypothetical protein